jgi:serine protease Do
MGRLKSFINVAGFRYGAAALIAVALLAGGMLIASSFGHTAHAQPAVREASGGAPASFADLVEAVGPSVVNVKITRLEKTEFPDMPGIEDGPFGDVFRRFFGEMQRQPHTFKSRGAGSGVIINADGTILTNNHVVEGAQEITVTMSDQKEFKARVVGRDPKTDLAVIRIDAKGDFKAARLGNSDALRVGDWIIAVGNPFGLSNTVTAGIVSAKGRIIGAGPYDDFIQTDAPINPGNSGGPLFNMKGEVVGIATAIIPNGQGIGFAIPISTAKNLLPELVSKGSVTRGYLGVNIQDVTPELAASLHIKEAKGALVGDVMEGTPAEKAGIKRGDVIVAFNGREIKNSHELSPLVAATPVGKEVPVKIVRDGKELTVKVTTARMESKEPQEEKVAKASEGKWGLQFEELTAERGRELGIKTGHGVVITDVRPGSPAAEAALRAGDVVLEVNRHPVKSVDDMKEKLAKADPAKEGALLLVQRGENTFYVVLKG